MTRLRQTGEQVVGIHEMVPTMSASGDGKGGLIAVEPAIVFENKNIHSRNTSIWEERTGGSGTISFNYTRSSVELSVGTDAGAFAERRSTAFSPYTPGKVQSGGFTADLEPPKENLRQEYGFADSSDGMFFRMDGLEPQFVMRSSVTGAMVETVYTRDMWEQADGTKDALDGKGSSGITLDVTNMNLLIIQYLWQGAGFFRYGFRVGKEVIFFHHVEVGNIFELPWIRHASLPIFYRIENTGTTASASTLFEVCCEISSIGGAPKVGYSFSAATLNAAGAPLAVTTSTTEKPLLLVRARQDLPTATENRITGRLIGGSLLVAGADALIIVKHIHDPEYTINIGAVTGGPYVVGETLLGLTSGCTATLTVDNTTSLQYIETGQNGVFVAGETVQGQTSGATSVIAANGATVWSPLDPDEVNMDSGFEYSTVLSNNTVTPAALGGHTHNIDHIFQGTAAGNKALPANLGATILDRHSEIHQNYDSSNGEVMAYYIVTLAGSGTAFGSMRLLEYE